jgi:hypothetical protein
LAVHHRRTRVTIALLVALVLVTALAAACSAQATGGALAASGSSGGAATAGSPAANDSAAAVGAAGANDDWSRIAAALAWMQADVPTKPVVVLLGGSAARESTTSDGSWRNQVQAAPNNGPATLAWNMGSHNRTMAQNLAIVKALPTGIHAVVFVGINLGSFTSTQQTASISLPSPAPSAGDIPLQQPHQYSTKTGILTTSQKRAMVQQWLSKRYPVYKANFSRNATLLETLIKVCRTRGYNPVLFELPRNTQIIGSSLATPTAKFRAKCVALHRKYGVPWVSFVSAAKLPNGDFYDIWHLVEPGRAIWQKLLSARTAALLKQYGYGGT